MRSSALITACLVTGLVVPSGLAAQTAAVAPGRSIEIVLDASGSMNARLADGRSRLDGAREALGVVVPAIPATARLSLRLYGDQSPRARHDCRDTRIAVPFGAAATAAAAALAAVKGITAQGYTPITWVIEQAAGDLATEATADRLVVLVSDGKETCEGDPCAAARALTKAGAKVTIHTVGFGVDSAARLQLQCIARATGGTYFPAESAAELANALKKATVTSAMTIAVETSGPGRLTVKGADLSGHKVIDSVSGTQVAMVSSLGETVTVPSGIYTVTIGAGAWRGIEVKAGETTVLAPGRLRVEGAALAGHAVVDPETAKAFGMVSATMDSLAVLPGTYDVMFGQAVWSGVRIESGQRTILQPGIITLRGASINGHRIAAADGREVGSVSATGASMPLPPGSYTVQIAGKAVPFTLAEAQRLEIDMRSPR